MKELVGTEYAFKYSDSSSIENLGARSDTTYLRSLVDEWNTGRNSCTIILLKRKVTPWEEA